MELDIICNRVWVIDGYISFNLVSSWSVDQSRFYKALTIIGKGHVY